jgi:hypothetical protein
MLHIVAFVASRRITVRWVPSATTGIILAHRYDHVA